METSGDAQATGMTEAQAADAFERLLSGQSGDSGADEPLKKAPEGDDPEDAPEEDAEGTGPDADAEDRSEEDEDPDEADEQPATITVKVDGAELQVTLEEAAAGYSRTQDYTRKTMALAENVKAFEAERATLAQEREQYLAVLGQWEQQLQQSLYDPAETAALRDVDPAEYAARLADEQDRQNRLQALTGEQRRLAEQTAREQQQAHQRAIQAAEQGLLDAVPEWKSDTKKAQAGLQVMWDYAATYGYSPADILSNPDHRALLILKDAAAYRALKSKAPETRAKVDAVKAAQPGAKATTPPKASEITRSKQRLAKTGRVEDAQIVLERLLGG